MTRKILAWSLVALVSIVSIVFYTYWERQRRSTSLAARVEQIVRATRHREVSCPDLATARPLVLLALGQSNAGNHGTSSTRPEEPVTLIAEGKCVKAADPLPGGTGTGASIWQRLPALLSMQHDARPVVLSVLAVDATSIEDWTSPDSPLKARLASHVASMRHLGLAPALVLWQQGEADAQLATSVDEYATGLRRLATALNEAGANAPIILARSTICRSGPSKAIRRSIDATVANDHRFRLGPDTDGLSSDAFRNGCHLTDEGLDRAADMWARTINTEVSMTGFAEYSRTGNASSVSD